MNPKSENCTFMLIINNAMIFICHQCIDKLIGFEGEHRGWQVTPVNMRTSQMEMKRARKLIQKCRLIPGPDHFPIKSSFNNYRYFMESLKEVVMTTRIET